MTEPTTLEQFHKLQFNLKRSSVEIARGLIAGEITEGLVRTFTVQANESASVQLEPVAKK